MKACNLILGILACGVTGFAFAGTSLVLGTSTPLPILDGGMLSVAVAGLVVGIRIIRRK